MIKNKRGANRPPGSPGLPGAGRPPKERTITLSEVSPNGIAPSVTGTAIIGRSLIKIALEDGRRLTIWID